MHCDRHGSAADCYCTRTPAGKWTLRSALGALGVGIVLGIVLSLPWLALGCAALTSAANKVTPADRAKAYEAEAKTAKLECKAYRFDRAAGLVPDVPLMSEICE